MKRALFILVFALAMSAGATPFVAFAQTPAAAPTPSPRVIEARTKLAVEKSIAAEKRLGELATEIAKLRQSRGDAKRLASLEVCYRRLAKSVASGDPVAVTKADAAAYLLLKDAPEALKAFAGRNDGPSRDLSRAAQTLIDKCLEKGGTPTLKVREVRAEGIGQDRGGEYGCDMSHPRTSEAESVVLKAAGDADAKRREADAAAAIAYAKAGLSHRPENSASGPLADVLRAGSQLDAEREAKRPSLAWRVARGVVISALVATAAYYVAGAFSEKSAADRNGKVAAGVVGALGGGLVLLEF